MSYNTKYKLHTVGTVLDKTDPLVAVLGEKPRRLPDFKDLIYRTIEYNPFEDRCKWYEHEEEMKSFSKGYPHVLFILEGRGEEDSDIWRKYFRNGKMETATTTIAFSVPSKSMLDNLDSGKLTKALAAEESSRR